VGYVSGDYRLHAVSYFIEPLFVHHDRTRVELFAYSTQGLRDAVTSACSRWWITGFLSWASPIRPCVIASRPTASMCSLTSQAIRHTTAWGVCPARCAGAGVLHRLFASTGLTEMDYLIGDAVLTPPETDDHFSERVWRLPRVWASYNDKAEAPVTAWRPSPEGVIWLAALAV